MKKPNPIHENVISFIQDFPKELGLNQYVDYDLQFSKSFLEPLKIILDSIGWSVEKTIEIGGFLCMKDQYTIDDGESKQEKWNRGLDIFIESVHKPDSALRQCAHNQKCYHELMDVRKNVLEYLNTLRWH